MQVKIAKEAGFCFGVKRAMQMAWDELEAKDEKIYALGPLIHNKQAVSRYEDKGLVTIDEIDKAPIGKNLIIRSHGVGENVYIDATSRDLNIIDTTCPFVKKIHNIVKKSYKEGQNIIIIGDKKHPEVIGINGWCDNTSIIIKDIDEIDNLNLDKNDKYCVVAQTTINLNLYEKIKDKLSNKLDNITFNNTICSATKVRQEAARSLSKEVDCMVVVGGKHSSNTQKLVQICEEFVPTLAIETKSDLDINYLNHFEKIGVTAGASTPEWIIEEVVSFIKNI